MFVTDFATIAAKGKKSVMIMWKDKAEEAFCAGFSELFIL